MKSSSAHDQICFINCHIYKLYITLSACLFIVIFCIPYPLHPLHQTSNMHVCIENFTLSWNIHNKKRNAPLPIFPFRSPFNAKMLIVKKYSFLIKFY